MEDEAVLPEDVLIEILINPPVKSLMRFRCVSKSWCALIRSFNFIDRYFEHGRKERVLLMRRLPPPPATDEGQGGGGEEVLTLHDLDSLDLLVSPNLSIPFLDDLSEHESYDFLGASTGLVCVALTKFKILGLCNPALREFQLLPPTPFSSPKGFNAFIVGSGFGYDARNNIYKVIQLWYTEHEDDEDDEDDYIRMDMFDSSTYSWRLIGALLPLVIHDPSLFYNGACHWSTADHCILAFHLSAEVFRKFKYPQFNDGKCASLVVLDGCLSLVRFGIHMEKTVEIWVMRQYCVRWVKEFEIGPYAFNCPLLVLRNEWLLVETSEKQLAALALHANEMKRFHFHGTGNSYMRAAMFTESLFSVKLFARVAELAQMKVHLENKKNEMRAQVEDVEDRLALINVDVRTVEKQQVVKALRDQLAGIKAKLGMED